MFPAYIPALPLLLLLLNARQTTAQIPPSWSTNFTPATLKLEATYSPNIRLTSGSAGGGNLFPSEASAPPRFRLSDDSQLAPDGGGGRRYTILLLDPDSPTPAGNGEKAYLHFLGTDYSLHAGAGAGADADARQLVAGGRPAVEYQGPKEHDGDHRYVALLYVQKDEAGPEVVGGQVQVQREGFSLEAFERESGVGEAVAGLYFRTAKRDGGTSSSRRRRRGRRDEVDDRMAGIGRAPPVRKRDVVEGRDEAWKQSVAGLGPRSVIGDVNGVWRKRVARLGQGTTDMKRDLEGVDDAWKKTAAGLGPRNEKRDSFLQELDEAWKKTFSGPEKSGASGQQQEKRDEEWAQKVAGLGPRRGKRV